MTMLLVVDGNWLLAVEGTNVQEEEEEEEGRNIEEEGLIAI